MKERTWLVLILDELDRLRTVTDTASVTTPADGATYNAASMPTTFSGQVGDDTNGAVRLARDPAMQAVVGRRAMEKQAAR